MISDPNLRRLMLVQEEWPIGRIRHLIAITMGKRNLEEHHSQQEAKDEVQEDHPRPWIMILDLYEANELPKVIAVIPPLTNHDVDVMKPK